MIVADVVGFLTSKTGVFAAVTALLAMIGTIVGLVQPMLKRRREAAEAKPKLVLSNVRINAPPPWSEAGEAGFELANAGGGKAILSDLRLVVRAHGATEMPKMVEAAAPIPQFTYKVTLSPAVREYDLRKKEFGMAPPHAYNNAEIEAFVVELRSTEPQWYEFELVIRWYDVKRPDEIRELVSPVQRIEFLPSIEDVMGRSPRGQG
jgi:hypothetical protein